MCIQHFLSAPPGPIQEHALFHLGMHGVKLGVFTSTSLGFFSYPCSSDAGCICHCIYLLLWSQHDFDKIKICTYSSCLTWVPGVINNAWSRSIPPTIFKVSFWTSLTAKTVNIIYVIHIFLFIDWLKVCHVIKNKLTILQKLLQSRK